MMPQEVDVAVIGGGPAGASAALRLAAAGRDVLVLERERDIRHKVCGEFLSGEALARLDALGLPAAMLGAAPIDRVRIVAGADLARGALPFRAAGLSRAVLDAALLRRAERLGARVARGAPVRGIERDARRILIRVGRTGTVRARNVVLATGKHELGGVRRSTRWSGRDGMIGLKMHFRLGSAAAARLGSAIELHLFPGGCAGLQPAGPAANLCITLGGEAFARAGHRFDRLLASIAADDPGFRGALDRAEPLWPRPLAVARVPYGFHHEASADDGPVWRVGDQFAVTASFTGDGLAIALESGTAAAEAILAGRTPLEYERSFGPRARRQLRPAMLLQGLVDRPALHRPALRILRCAPWLIGLAARWTRLPPAGGGERRAKPAGTAGPHGSLAADCPMNSPFAKRSR